MKDDNKDKILKLENEIIVCVRQKNAINEKTPL